MTNRLTFHAGYRNRMGKAYNSKHIGREGFEKPADGDTQQSQNVYWNYAVAVKGADFSKSEMLFYKTHLGPHVEAQNQKAIARRQYGRTQTIAQYKEKHPPEEVLLYLGTKNVDTEVLKAVFDDFRDWMGTACWDAEKDCGVKLLDAALHLDETTPHIHMRQVYLYRGKDGHYQVSQNKALEALGYERPDTSKPVGRLNNAKMTFTATCRDKLFELARTHGVELETEPLPKTDVGLPLREYIQREQAREAAAAEQLAIEEMLAERRDDAALEVQGLEAKADRLQAEITDLEDERDDVRDELERTRRAYSKEQAALEQKRKAAEDEAERIIDDARKEAQGLKETAIMEGAQSALGRMHAKMRQQAQEAQEQEDGYERG